MPNVCIISMVEKTSLEGRLMDFEFVHSKKKKFLISKEVKRRQAKEYLVFYFSVSWKSRNEND